MVTGWFDPALDAAGQPAGASRPALGAAVYPEAAAAVPRTLWQVLEATAEAFPDAAAIDDGESVLNYLDLMREARRIGDRLAAMGVGAGDRVGIRITSGRAELYLSILAVLSAGAAYVPVDVDDPVDRVELIWSAARVCAILGDDGEVTWRKARMKRAGTRLPQPEDDAWIIFTSGTTGIPKGVAVTHRSAAAFVDAEARLFLRDDPLRPGDRVLAGLSVAFDASCEEMWLAWRHGACLVPATRAVVKTGPELVNWLARRQVSVVSTVPTLAALWPDGTPHGVRLLILGGEACPPRLADRLAREGTEVWNTYGPTEATVVACAARLSGGEPVRIGLPLDGWRLAVADPASGQPVPWGEVGELVIGGVGVARYLDPERDAVAFRPLAALGLDRAYHTGDLVRADPAGLIYVGRADAQVKIRGYRIELSEIEAVLTELPGIGPAAVTTCERLPGVVELVAYYTVQEHARANVAGPLDRQAVDRHLRNRLPVHMLPAYLEDLPAMPLLPGGKVDRRNLPKPTSSGRLSPGLDYVAPATPAEKALADALAELLGLDVSVDSQFFDELGMSSLLAAHFCARARERAQLPQLSVKDVYLHPTVRSLASAVAGLPQVAVGPPGPPGPAGAPRVGIARYAACGADLLVIGDDTVIRKESSFSGYRAVAGVIQTGPVSIGREALIGEHTLLDIGTSVGNGSQLGHTSSLHESQSVPDGQHWHGSPAQRTDVDYRRVAALPCGPLRRLTHGTVQMLTLVFVTLPLAAGAGVAGLTKLPVVTSFAALGADGLTTADFYEDGLVTATALFCGAILTGAAVIVTVPRLLRRLVKPGRVYPLYGLHHAAHRAIKFLTNVEFYLELLGDSSYVVHYLLAMGYRMPDFEQTGSNFGAELEHENPFLADIGRGTMIADGATLIDADYSSTSFGVTPLSVGPGNFLGNAVAYPSGGRIGANCIVATKAMVPLDGPVRSDVGLLGSPSFEIPRSATTDHRFDHLRSGEEFRRRLRAKNRHNIGTMGLFLAVRWVHLFAVTLLALAAWDLYRGNPVLVLTGLTVATLLFSLGYFITVERAVLRFGSLRPRYCSIYDPYFWWHERYWKLMAPLVGMFDGTPFKGLVWRLLGVRVGRRVFDDGCSIAERTLVTIGDHCTLNAGSVIQCHSMEDGIFKSGYTVLEDGSTVGTGALVHYGVTMGQGSRLLADSFLMKGESVPPHARWGGNPARPMG